LAASSGFKGFCSHSTLNVVIKFRMSYLLSQGLQPLILLDMQSHNRIFFFVTLPSMENPFDKFCMPYWFRYPLDLWLLFID
jgi:hypothetical protein